MEDGGSAEQTCWASGADRDGSAGLAEEMHENWIEAVRYLNMEYLKRTQEGGTQKIPGGLMEKWKTSVLSWG